MSVLITLVCYVLPMILGKVELFYYYDAALCMRISTSIIAFTYGFYIICNIKYEDSESEETCEKCNSRERSLDQIFGNESKMKGAAIITCSNVTRIVFFGNVVNIQVLRLLWMQR